MASRAWTLGALAGLIAVPIGITVAPLMNSGSLPDVAAKSAEAVRCLAGVDLLKMLDARSPGARAVGELADTKGGHARTLAKPRQRALAKVREPKPLPDTFVKPLFGEAPEVAAIAPDKAPVQFAGVPTVLTQGPSSPPIFTIDPPGGGSPNPPPGGPSDPPPVVVPPAVPEPSTWAMMLIGFGAVGAALRRRRNRLPMGKAVVAQ